MDECSIMEKMKLGDESVLNDLEILYQRYVSTIVWQIIRGRMTEQDLQETVNDVFFRLWKHRDSIDLEKGTIKSYLAAIARSQAKNKLRQIRPKIKLIQEEDNINMNTPLENIEKSELRDALGSALMTFNEKDREIFIRYYYLYETSASISKRLGVKESTIKSKLHRGRKKLKQKLENMGFVSREVDC